MGYLLKEALKTLCGVNRWSYAVFWKFGCQNPKLLIWEECYHEPAPYTEISANSTLETAFNELTIQTSQELHQLINKMTLNYNVVVLGEGLVGRAAFSGSYQWILSEKFYGHCHPPEVQKEICQQFLCGMQTVAVIPVLPQGVVQFGSPLTILENAAFVNEVTSLILELGCVPGAILSEDYAYKPRPHPAIEMINCFPRYIDQETLTPTTTSESGLLYSAIDGCFTEEPAMDSTSHMITNPDEHYGFDPTPPVEIKTETVNETQYIPEWRAKNPSGDDLFDALGADFKHKLLTGCWNTSKAPKIEGYDYTLSSQPPMPSLGSNNVIRSSTGQDHLLEAIVSKGVQNSANSCMTNMNNSFAHSTPVSYSNLFGGSELKNGELFGFPKYIPRSGSSSSGSLYGCCSSVPTGYSKKPDDTSKTVRKKPKPGENPRPRPKDRQMIQDRVKELRELVPNGAKCSIDALLERTIKHMLFLQSVMKHADKLKQAGESKITSKDGNLLVKDKFEGGATWAYEVGSQSMMCPIVVEDLNQPGQMLVEMLYEERGLFLEIADVIRGLGLTILKGVMETRNDKIWARFAVEANRDITRMEIFISLVHLLEQSPKTGVSNEIISKTMNGQQFRAVASVP